MLYIHGLTGKLVLAFKMQLKYNFLLKLSLTTNLIPTLGRVYNVISAIAVPYTFFICTTYQNYYNYLLLYPGLQLYCEIYC